MHSVRATGSTETRVQPRNELLDVRRSQFVWWPVILPWPARTQWPRWGIPLYLLGSDMPVSVLSAYLAFCGHVVYPTYLDAPRLLSLSALQDQVAAAMLMWVAMLVVLLAAATIVVVGELEPAQ